MAHAKLYVALLLGVDGATQAQVTTSPWLSPPPVFQEDFDSILSGSFLGLGVFGFPAVAKWSRVEIYGAPFGPGGVEFDSVWVRPN